MECLLDNVVEHVDCDEITKVQKGGQSDTEASLVGSINETNLILNFLQCWDIVYDHFIGISLTF
jgi:hypothetical protein